jgi:hypothetical protein
VFIDARNLTAEMLAAIMTESRERAKRKHNADGSRIVSDNASAMVKMGSLWNPSM